MISIPKWSDFSVLENDYIPHTPSISIPKWSDFSLLQSRL